MHRGRRLSLLLSGALVLLVGSLPATLAQDETATLAQDETATLAQDETATLAQDETATHAQDEPATEVERIVAQFREEYELAREAMRAQLDALRESDEYRKAYEESRASRDFGPVRALTDAVSTPVMEEWRAKAAELATRYPEGEDEILVATMRMDLALTENPKKLFLDTVAKHCASPALAPFLESTRRIHRAVGAETYTELMNRVIAENPSDQVRAWAYFGRGSAALAQRGDDEARARGLADYDRVVELVDPDSSLGMRARGPKFAESRLQEGMRAPDIRGVDLFGEEFALSDYAGKVVLLDFWGDW